jgi:Fe-S-cluster containining protein
LNSKEKEFPEGLVPLGDSEFQFECHPGVECFTFCCRNVDMTLYPYDVIRLKRELKLDSEEFVRTHTYLQKGDNPYFPTVKLKLVDDEKKSCPFLADSGCSVYRNRPSACRTYPLEIAVDRTQAGGNPDEYYFMTDHPYCLGHREQKSYTVKGWIRNQQLLDYNSMNGIWAEIDTLFRQNPWKGEGAAGEKQQLAFMVCYNIDGFRRFMEQHNLLKQYRLAKDVKKSILREDSELLKFGFEWLKLILSGKSSLIKK